MNDFHCCLSVIDDLQHVRVKASHKFSNTLKGFRELGQWIKKHCKEDLSLVIVMEATGVYHENLSWFLYQEGYQVSILQPNRAKKFFMADGRKSKNDTIDSRGLSQIGAEKRLDLWIPPSSELYNLRTVTRHHQNLNEILTVYSNQLHSLNHGRSQFKPVVSQLTKNIKAVEKQLAEIEQLINRIISEDPILSQQCANLTSIKGVGKLTFAVIAAETDGFALFDKASSLVSYAGYDVVENQSGKHSGRTKISKKGNSRIRRILHMPALWARDKAQPQFHNLYERVYDRTKIKMKGCVAVQKKLLVMMYYLWKKNEKYDPLFNQKKVAREQAQATRDELHNEALIKESNIEINA